MRLVLVHTRLATLLPILSVVQFVKVVNPQPINVPSIFVLVAMYPRRLVHDSEHRKGVVKG